MKPKALHLSADPVDVKTEYSDHSAEITLSAKTLKKGIFIEETHGYMVDFSNNFFDLKPNEESVVKVEYPLLDDKPSFKIRTLK